MKIYRYLLLLPILFTLVLWSCEKKYPEPKMPDVLSIKTDFSAFRLVAPASGQTVTVEVALPTDTKTITWDATTSNDGSLVTYKWLAVLATTPNFNAPLLSFVSDNMGKNPVLTLTNQRLDDELGSLSVAYGSTVNLKWTVEATSASGKKTLAPSPFLVSLFRKPNYPLTMNLVGGGTSAGWNNAAAIPMKRIADGIFEIYAYIDGSFKFLPTIGSWNGDWELASNTTSLLGSQINGMSTDPISGSTFTGYTADIVNNGNTDCPLPTAGNGFYRITLNFVTTPKKLEVVRTNWGIIGDATPGGWGSETAMTLQPVSPGVFKGSYTWKSAPVTLTTNDMKFRAGDWPINLGGASGSMTYGGSNIPVTGGANKVVTLVLDPSGNYTYTIQ
ncbi:MAG: SusF/SusE family outer membrane protein [Bacteroidetes bacterium]|nr:MAG: SusF/SusE family outer membrane protein [Bacteroidota bacterium]TAG90655.1 MAG: SusF/SusE family outer membrane protein [Bacteroidota bacterium]